jgi:hypothetical protein
MMVERGELQRRWVHSHEEDSDEEMVFRPEGFDFPPSRGRAALELRPDGSCIQRSPGPRDVAEEAAGTWELNDEELLIRAEGSEPRSLRVVEAGAEKLVVRR